MLQFTPKPPPACALVVLTHSSLALRAKTAYVGGGYELHLVPLKYNLFLHASMTPQIVLHGAGVNCNELLHEKRKNLKKVLTLLETHDKINFVAEQGN